MKVLVFNHVLFNVSETFIYKQVTGMPRDIDVELLGFAIKNEESFPLTNKKYLVKRVDNTIDRVFVWIRKYIFRIRYRLSLYTHFAVKKILTQSKFDVVHAHFGFNALLIYPLARLFNIPLVVTFHGLDASPQYLKKKEYRKRIRKMLDFASAIIIVSPHMKDTLRLANYPEKTHIISCGVDPDEFKVAERILQSDTITILHSGRLVSKKGVPDLISVFSVLSHKYSNIRLYIIGDGHELKVSRQMADGARMGSIKFFGAKSHEEVRKFMSEADIFVLNSRVGDGGDMEGMPVSLLEAMSMQMAVVTSRHAGIPYAVTHGVDGLLVDEKDNAALLLSLEKLINDATLRKQLGESARRTVVNRFTTAETNRKIAEVYRSVVKSN